MLMQLLLPYESNERCTDESTQVKKNWGLKTRSQTVKRSSDKPGEKKSGQWAQVAGWIMFLILLSSTRVSYSICLLWFLRRYVDLWEAVSCLCLQILQQRLLWTAHNKTFAYEHEERKPAIISFKKEDKWDGSVRNETICLEPSQPLKQLAYKNFTWPRSNTL